MTQVTDIVTVDVILDTSTGSSSSGGGKPSTRVGYFLDGVNDFYTLEDRAINVDEDIYVQWEQYNVTRNRDQTIISQNILSLESSREFSIDLTDKNKLRIIVGGASYTFNNPNNMAKNGKYRITLVGTILSLYIDDTLTEQTGFVRGGAREPSAMTKIGARSNDSVEANTDYFQGVLFNTKINKTMWFISDNESATQIANPDNSNTLTANNYDASRWFQVKGDIPYTDQYFISGGVLLDSGKLTTDSKLWGL